MTRNIQTTIMSTASSLKNENVFVLALEFLVPPVYDIINYHKETMSKCVCFTMFTSIFVSAPEGLAPPVHYVINDTTLRVSWTAPTKPHGQITVYYLYLDDERINTGLAEAGSYVLYKLLPNTVYMLQV